MDSDLPTLDQLRDIQLPPPPPIAADWPVYLAVAVLGLSIVAIIGLARAQRPTWRREALAEIRRLSALEPSGALFASAVLVRRVACRLADDPAIARVTGPAYLDRLDRLFATRFFTQGTGALLGDPLYRPDTAQPADVEDLLRGLERLIRSKRGR